MTTVISCRDLSRRYGTGRSAFTAVDEVNLEVRTGEIFGLLGTNGAGKTSTMEILEGLERPSSGGVTVFGMDPYKERRELRPYTGIMLQSGGLPQELTAGETLKMWRGTCTAPAPVDEVLELVDLGHRADVRVGMLSGGEQRRLDLACALIGRPRVVFLDEPTTGLDPESRRNTWELLERLRGLGVTMVLTTHYLDEAEQLCDRMVLMHQGRVRRQGTVEEIISAYPATIIFGHDAQQPELPPLLASKASYTERNGQWMIQTKDLQKDLQVLLAWAEKHHKELVGLQARAASLESAFFDLAETAQAQEVPV